MSLGDCLSNRKKIIAVTVLHNLPGPTSAPPTCISTTTSSVATYSLASGTYIYDATGNYSVARSFGPQPTSFAALPQSTQQIRPSLSTQVHGT
jgi:hypothetical protein